MRALRATNAGEVNISRSVLPHRCCTAHSSPTATPPLKNRGGELSAAFTLAEVLITLTIIGVIAAITIPNLMQKHQEQEFIQKLKKNYSILSNAYKLAIQEYGDPDDWKIEYDTSAGAKKLALYLTPYLKVQRDCTNNPCFADNYKALFNVYSLWAGINSERKNYWYQILLEDGTAISFWSAGEIYGSSIVLDLNNKKGPNRWGVDSFMLVFKKDRLIPSGQGFPKLTHTNGNQCTYNGTHNRNGATCGVHAIYKGNMDYLRRDISSEW